MSRGESSLYRLMSWLSPAFPVGGFSYSHGIEYAVEAGLVHDAGTTRGWIEGILIDGAGCVDATLFAAAWPVYLIGPVHTGWKLPIARDGSDASISAWLEAL